MIKSLCTFWLIFSGFNRSNKFALYHHKKWDSLSQIKDESIKYQMHIHLENSKRKIHWQKKMMGRRKRRKEFTGLKWQERTAEFNKKVRPNIFFLQFMFPWVSLGIWFECTRSLQKQGDVCGNYYRTLIRNQAKYSTYSHCQNWTEDFVTSATSYQIPSNFRECSFFF